MPDSDRLLTPGQVRLALQIRAMGESDPGTVAQQLGVPEDRLRRSFRLDRRVVRVDPIAYLQQIAQVPLRPMTEDDDD